MNWTLLINSFSVSALATLLSVSFGLMAALWLAGLAPARRGRWLAVAIMALALPPFLVTNCWLHYLGAAGAWHQWLPLNIYSLGGSVWILALLTWPITLLAVLGSWRRLEAAQLESDMAVTGFALVRGLLLPLARGALLQAAVLTFVLALNNFAVPAILQVKVFPAEVWVLFNTSFDTLGALKMSWPLVAVPLLALIYFRRAEVAWPRAEGPVSAKLFRQQLGARGSVACGAGTVVISLLAVALPLVQLAATRLTWSELPGALAAGQQAIWNSFSISALTATLCVVVGLASWRWPLGIVLWLPFLVPGVLLGIGLIAVFNRPLFSVFYQHAGIVILALGIRYLAFGWNGASRALRGVDRDLTDAARLDGASRWQLLRHIHWPQISPQLAAAWYIVFLLCLWDVESMVLIVPPGGETLALRIFNLLHYGHNAQVNSLCLALLALAVAPLLLCGIAKFGLRIADWGRGTGGSNRHNTPVISPISPIRPLAPLIILIPALLLTGCSVDTATGKKLDSKFFSRVEVIGARGVGVGEFNKPRSIAIDRDDNIYVVDMTARVQKFSPDGKFLLLWQLTQTDLGKPKGMGRDADGNIIVVEPHYQRINIFSPDGKLVNRWGKRGTNSGQLIMPRAVAVNSHGNFLISEYSEVDRVQEFSAKGDKLVQLIGHPGLGNGEFNRAEGLDVDALDRIYVADSCNHRIQIFSPDGKFLRSYGKPGTGAGEMSYPYDVRVDKVGRQYVCEFENSRIQIFDANGKSLEIIGGPGCEPGQFSNPYAIALDSKGNLYVADSQNHRVQKFVRRQDVASDRATPALCRFDSEAAFATAPFKYSTRFALLPLSSGERAGVRAVVTICPEGTTDNSPRFQPWVQREHEISLERTTPLHISARSWTAAALCRFDSEAAFATAPFKYSTRFASLSLSSGERAGERAVVTICPEGTTDNSPRFQPWVKCKNAISPEGMADNGRPFFAAIATTSSEHPEQLATLPLSSGERAGVRAVVISNPLTPLEVAQ